MKSRLQAVEMKFKRHMIEKTRMNKERNEDIKEILGVENCCVEIGEVN